MKNNELAIRIIEEFEIENRIISQNYKEILKFAEDEAIGHRDENEGFWLDGVYWEEFEAAQYIWCDILLDEDKISFLEAQYL